MRRVQGKKKKRAVHKNLERTPPLVYLELLWRTIQLARRRRREVGRKIRLVIISLKARWGRGEPRQKLYCACFTPSFRSVWMLMNWTEERFLSPLTFMLDDKEPSGRSFSCPK